MKNTLKANIFSACKKIMRLEIRDSVKGLFEKLRKRTIGQMDRQFNIQFLRFLLLDQNKELIPFDIEGLSKDEIFLIEKLHYTFVCMDKKVLSFLNKHIAESEKLIPYNIYDYTFRNKKLTGDILDGEIINCILDGFRNHPSLKIIDKSYQSFPQFHKVDTEKLLRGVLAFENKIDKVGIFKVPSDFNEPIISPENQQFVLFKNIMFALVAFRSSIKVLNQLIYQAFYMDKLSVLDSDNVFLIPKHSQNNLGESIQIKSILDEKIGIPVPGEIIKIKIDREKHPIDDIFCLSKLNFSLNKTESATQELWLRKVNQDLCCFSNLT